jgi:serine/threonine protein kinase
MDQLPFVLGKYRVFEKITEGRWSTLYKAEEQDTQQVVAVKVLRSAVFGEPQYLTTLLTTQSLPNLLKIFEHGATPDGRRYVVSELLDGRTVEDEVRQYGPFTPEQALEIVGDLTGIFAALQQPYQTLKPGHVFLHKTPSRQRTTILLGLGESELRQTNDNLTRADFPPPLRELAFCSPARIKGIAETITNDLYSLGALWYYMLTGKYPYPAGSEHEMELLIVQKEFPEVQRQCVVPAMHSQIIRRLTHHQRSEQYQNFFELKQALMPLLPNRSVSAHSMFVPSAVAEMEKLSNRVRGRILEMQLRENDPLRLREQTWMARFFGRLSSPERFWYLHPTYLIGRNNSTIRAFSWVYLQQVGFRDDAVSLYFIKDLPNSASLQRTSMLMPASPNTIHLRYNGSSQELFEAVAAFSEKNKGLHLQEQAHTAPEAELFSNMIQWRE